MLLKLDLKKTFDRLEWSFLRNALLQLHFPTPFVQLIMYCVSTSSISDLYNGSPTTFFQPTRSIRQGDPLSPYLFILSMEVLSHNINNAVDYQLRYLIQLSRGGPHISHLFFAFDIILASKITD